MKEPRSCCLLPGPEFVPMSFTKNRASYLCGSTSTPFGRRHTGGDSRLPGLGEG